MLLAEQFRKAVIDALTKGEATMDLLPMAFARATVSVLPVSGAGLSVTDQLRVPLAASDQNVVTAERLQTTIGEGPCLAAVSLGRPLVADLAQMAASWPIYHERFVAETPYRTVASFPLRSAEGSCLGALDLYSISPDTLTRAELEQVDAAVAVPIAGILFSQSADGGLDGVAVPDWLSAEPAAERLNVWVAVGISMEHLQVSNSDALALLRGYAYSYSLTLDEVARHITNNRVQPEELLA
jgi:hypothetical protein